MKRILLLMQFILLTLLPCKSQKNEVKFEKDGSFYVSAIINDSIEGRFVFDTGASGLYFDSTFVKRHSSIIKTNLDTARMRGAGATDDKQVYVVKDTVKISVGNYIHSFPKSPILKLTDINGENIAGIIGNEFIKNKILIIDNERSVLKIDSVINPKKYNTIIPFKYVDKRVYFPVELKITDNQAITADLLMDLGCADAVILNTPYFNSLKSQNILPQKIVDYTILFGGALGGNSNGGDFRISSLKLGNHLISNPIISFSKDTLGAFSKTDYDGLIGNEILDRYNFAIDYYNQKLYLTENSKSSKVFKSSLAGFYAMKMNDIATVMSIYYQSDAYKSGIRLGDTIVSINNKRLKDLSELEFKDEMKDEGKQVKLTILRNKKPIEISFYLKYLL
jgi:hypothetical protein